MLDGSLVRLAPFGPDDVTDDYVGWLNDPETFQYLGTKFGQTRATARRYVDGIEPPNVLCRIIDKASGAHVGNVALHSIHTVHRSGELGILIGSPTARGRGFGREACALLIAYAFEHLNLHKITAGTVDKNVPMKQVFLGLGFALEGTLRNQFYLRGEYHDIYRFGLLRDAFMSRRDA